MIEQLKNGVNAMHKAGYILSANIPTNTYGSGKLYKTSVERQTEGALSAEDLHQASVLTSQLLIGSEDGYLEEPFSA